MNGPTTSSSLTMATKLSAKDICSIIQACSEGGVTEITIGDLYIAFNGAKCPEYLTDVANIPETSLRSVPSEPVTTEKDEDLTSLLFSDPAQYEEMVEIE